MNMHKYNAQPSAFKEMMLTHYVRAFSKRTQHVAEGQWIKTPKSQSRDRRDPYFSTALAYLCSTDTRVILITAIIPNN